MLKKFRKLSQKLKNVEKVKKCLKILKKLKNAEKVEKLVGWLVVGWLIGF